MLRKGSESMTMKRTLLAAAAALALFGAGQAAQARGMADTVDPARWTWEKEVFVPMRDGVNLSTDIILPKDRKGPLDTSLIRTPSHKDGLEIDRKSTRLNSRT